MYPTGGLKPYLPECVEQEFSEVHVHDPVYMALDSYGRKWMLGSLSAPALFRMGVGQTNHGQG
jgi:hypothetical protein